MNKNGKALSKLAAHSYWWLMFTLVPLYFDNMYYNISKAKLNMFVVCSFVVLGLTAAALIFSKDKVIVPPRDMSVYAFIGLGAVSLVSCLCSRNPRLTFWGYDGWGIGAYTIMCFALFLCLMTTSLEYTTELWLPVLAISGVVLFIGTLNCAGVDVFGMREHIIAYQYYRYMSTIGHDNWYNGYLSLLVPLFAMLYISCRSKLSQAVYLVYLSMAFINVILGTSDGIFLGLGLCAVFAIPFILGDALRLRRFCVLTALFGTIFLLAMRMPAFNEKIADKEGLVQKLLDWRVAVAMIAIGAAGYAILRYGKLNITPKAAKILIIIAEAAVLSVICYYIADTVIHFSDSWGTDRGRIWRRSIEIFNEQSLWKKLIGLGPGGLRRYYNGSNPVFPKETLLASHNEALQFLMSTGILGLLCWLTAWGGIIASYFKYKLWRGRQAAYIVPIAAYLGQSLINSPTVTNVAMLCAITAVHFITRPEKALPAAQPE